VIFQDFPGPGIYKKEVQDFPGDVGTLCIDLLVIICALCFRKINMMMMMMMMSAK